MVRPSWHEYFFEIATLVATRATCDRAHVGCVIVKDKHILSTGFNGSVSGAPHCDDEGHFMEDGHCIRTSHAEANAVAQAAKLGIGLAGSTAYVTHRPCLGCARLLLQAGVVICLYDKSYGTTSYAALGKGFNAWERSDVKELEHNLALRA